MRLWKRRTLATLLVCTLFCSQSAALFQVRAHTGCDNAPVIIIPGLGQSETYLFDEDGNVMLDEDGAPMTGFLSMNVPKLIQTIIAPLLLSVIFQRDMGLSNAMYPLADLLLGANSCGPDGQSNRGLDVIRYPYSYAQYTPKERAEVHKHIPLTRFSSVLAEDHIYYFAYNSFGNMQSITTELYEMIQLAKMETDHDKVTLVPISQGGSIMDNLLERDREKGIFGDIDTVVYVVPAIDGSAIVGDLYNRRLSLENHMLYRDLFPGLVSGYMGYLINLALRLLPKAVVHTMFGSVLDTLEDLLLRNCTMLWGLVPKADFPSAYERLFAGTGDDYGPLRDEVQYFYRAQQNAHENILAMQASGVTVYNICEYNVPLFCIVPAYADYNADGVIHLDSTSMGATSGYVDTPLPENYQQQNTHCNQPGHNHMDQRRLVDASTGILPDHTFYFYNQSHIDTAANDVIINLAVVLSTATEPLTVYSLPEYPQFNEGRNPRRLHNTLLPAARQVSIDGLTATEYTVLQEAIAVCETQLANTVVDQANFLAAEAQLEALLVQYGILDDQTNVGERILTGSMWAASTALYYFYGPRGFTDCRQMNSYP